MEQIQKVNFKENRAIDIFCVFPDKNGAREEPEYYIRLLINREKFSHLIYVGKTFPTLQELEQFLNLILKKELFLSFIVNEFNPLNPLNPLNLLDEVEEVVPVMNLRHSFFHFR